MIHLKKIFLTTIYCAWLYCTIAQNSKIDSIFQILINAQKDTSKVALFNFLADEFQRHDLTKAKFYSNEALSLAKKLSFPEGEIKAMNNLGLSLEMEGKYQEAIRNYKRAAFICEQTYPNSNKLAGIYNNIGIANSSIANYPDAIIYMKKALDIKITNGPEEKIAGQLHNIGIIYYYKGQIVKALEYYFEALKIFENLGDEEKISECFNSIGAAYSMLNNYEKALKYYYLSLDIFKKSGNKIQLSNCYDNIGEVQLSQGLIEKAEENIRKALELRESMGYQKGVADCYNELGDVHEAKKQYPQALEFKLKAIRILEKSGNQRELADCFGDMGNICIKMDHHKKAVSHFEKSISIAEPLNIFSVLYNSYFGITTAYEKTGQFKTALNFHRKYSSISDSIFNENKNKTITELEMQYEVEKKEQQNQLLFKENELQLLAIQSEKRKRLNQFVVLGGVIVFIIFVSLFFYSRYRYHHLSRMEEEKRRQEQLRFKMVINAEENERARIASELHDSLGHLLSSAKLNLSGLEDNAKGEERKLFDNSMNLIDEACNEVRTISHNLMPDALIRLGLIPAIRNLIKKINDTGQLIINFQETMKGDRLDKSIEISIYRIIQEILNNMLRHSQAKVISIHLEKEDGKLILAASDNGNGFDVSEIHNKSGIGWKNILSRVDIMNGNIHIDSKINKGSTIKIEIPV